MVLMRYMAVVKSSGSFDRFCELLMELYKEDDAHNIYTNFLIDFYITKRGDSRWFVYDEEELKNGEADCFALQITLCVHAKQRWQSTGSEVFVHFLVMLRKLGYTVIHNDALVEMGKHIQNDSRRTRSEPNTAAAASAASCCTKSEDSEPEDGDRQTEIN